MNSLTESELSGKRDWRMTRTRTGKRPWAKLKKNFSNKTKSSLTTLTSIIVHFTMAEILSKWHITYSRVRTRQWAVVMWILSHSCLTRWEDSKSTLTQGQRTTVCTVTRQSYHRCQGRCLGFRGDQCLWSLPQTQVLCTIRTSKTGLESLANDPLELIQPQSWDSCRLIMPPTRDPSTRVEIWMEVTTRTVMRRTKMRLSSINSLFSRRSKTSHTMSKKMKVFKMEFKLNQSPSKSHLSQNNTNRMNPSNNNKCKYLLPKMTRCTNIPLNRRRWTISTQLLRMRTNQMVKSRPLLTQCTRKTHLITFFASTLKFSVLAPSSNVSLRMQSFTWMGRTSW